MLYAAPGTAGAKIAYKAQYDNFIGGKWVAPVKGQYFDVITPISGKVYTKAARSSAEDIELALDAAHAAADKWGKTPAGRARQRAAEDRRPHRSQPRAAGLRRDRGQRQADPRNAERRHSADRRPLPLFRRLRARAGRQHQRDRRDHRRLPLPRTAGRRRPDHSVELPDPDGGLEAGPGAGRRQLRGAEAGRVHPDQHPDPGRADRRPAAARRAEHRQRLRPRSRHAAGHEQAHRQDRLHRLHHHRPRDRAGRGQQPDSGHAGTGRQVAQHLLRRRHGQGRRLPRQGHRRPGAVRLQPGRGLHLPEPRADPGIHLRQVHGARAGRAWPPSSRATRSTPTP